jgi:hypothetical protein
MPHHVVVDGSNIATEGRTHPSLQQLNDAVLAYMAEHPKVLVTVVVDATFGHRIDSKEVAEFDAAIANNELVAPPAGAIGRGDAFVLSIANKAKATILSNDSFQEFHPQYPWLFDEGRLVGGKPVPHVGWVFVDRLPVRGPTSRKAMNEAKRKDKPKVGDETVRVGSPEASKPMPVPKAPPPGPAKSARKQAATPKALAPKAAASKAPAVTAAPADSAAPGHARSTVNDLLSFLTFVEGHPVGTSVNAIVDHYSSHGAYVRVGDIFAYVPLRLMADPAPRSAREFMKVGESITLVVDSLVPAKRSVDLAVPGVGSAPTLAPAAVKKSRAKKAAAPAQKPAPAKKATAASAKSAAAQAPAKAKKAVAKRAAPEVSAPPKKAAPVKKAPAARPAPVKKAAAKKAPVKKAAAKKTAAKKAAS